MAKVSKKLCTKAGKLRSTLAVKKMRVTRRFVNTKRHTVGYTIGGDRKSLSETMAMATQGQVAGVRVVGNHIQSATGRRSLSDLPTTIIKD